jgi:membrane-associated phospholipid phosphatase
MLVATPVDGAHYAVDLLGGAAVAGFAIALTTYMTRVVCVRSIAQPVILNEAQGLPSSRPA